MQLTGTQIAFKKFAKKVQTRTKQRITKRDVKASGEMHKSISFNVKVSKNSIQLIYGRASYTDYQDRGVSGVKNKFNTPFSYKSKKPPAGVFAKWAKQKGIKPRDKTTGKFITNKQFGFIMANHIYKNGIKPKKFFADSFTKEFQGLPKPIMEAFGNDAIQLLKSAYK